MAEPIQLINVVRGGISGKTQDLEMTAADRAELLHPPRSPVQNGPAMKSERTDEVIGTLRRAGEGARKNLRMCDHHSLLPGHCFPSELDEWLQRFGVQWTWAAFGYIPGVKAICEHNTVYELPVIPVF